MFCLSQHQSNLVIFVCTLMQILQTDLAAPVCPACACIWSHFLQHVTEHANCRYNNCVSGNIWMWEEAAAGFVWDACDSSIGCLFVAPAPKGADTVMPYFLSILQDYSFVYKPELCQLFVGCSMFAPLKTLPSQCLPPIKVPEDCIYRPSWTMGRDMLNPVPVMTYLNKDRYAALFLWCYLDVYLQLWLCRSVSLSFDSQVN